jgi:hypothetical protein
VIADGTAISTITVTVRDVNGNPVAGQAVALAATGSNNTLVQPGVTDPFGVATGTIASTSAEQKTITATVNPGASQVVVAQQPTSTSSATRARSTRCSRPRPRRRRSACLPMARAPRRSPSRCAT